MDKVLVIDFETSGTDPAKDHPVEVAMAMFSLEQGRLANAVSLVIQAPSNEAEKINGIPMGIIQGYGCTPQAHAEAVHRWMSRADVVLAHNADFDRSFAPELSRNLRPWVCTLNDVEWSRADHVSGNRVGDLALAHGIGVTKLHRALSDVMLICELLEREHDRGVNLPDLIARAMRPKARYRAVTGRFDAALNERLKTAGFRWSPEGKSWWKKLVVEDVERLRTQYPFDIVEWP